MGKKKTEPQSRQELEQEIVGLRDVLDSTSTYIAEMQDELARSNVERDSLIQLVSRLRTARDVDRASMYSRRRNILRLTTILSETAGLLFAASNGLTIPYADDEKAYGDMASNQNGCDE